MNWEFKARNSDKQICILSLNWCILLSLYGVKITNKQINYFDLGEKQDLDNGTNIML